MGRNIEIDARLGGGAAHEILFGEVTIEATAMHGDTTKTVFPGPKTYGISNGLAVLENVDVSPDGPEPAWAYRMTFRDHQSGRGWSEMVGVPTGTTPVKYPALPRFTTAVPPETTKAELQNWVATTESAKNTAVAAAAEATAPTDEMVAAKINTPGSATKTALSAAIGDSVDGAQRHSRISVDTLVAPRAATFQVTPTYDGTGQTVHPDVVFIPGGWNGYRYWMAMTPYPNGVDTTENPSIIASNDGETWVEPAGITNPIAKPATGFWPDPDLVFDPIKRRLYCVWLGMRSAWSDDGVTWTAPTVMFNALANEVAPSIVKVGNAYWMWSCQRMDVGEHKILLRKGPSLESGAGWSAPVECEFPAVPGLSPWHMDVADYTGEFVTLAAFCTINTSGANTHLYAMTSPDGVVWERSEQPLIAPRPGVWDATNIYRACLVRTSGAGGAIGDVWYSARSEAGQWHIGRTELMYQDPATLTRSPLSSFAEHKDTVRASATVRNLITVNPSLLESGGIVPTGWSNNLAGGTGHGWDAARQAYTVVFNGGNLTRTVAIPVTEGIAYCFTLEHASDVAGISRLFIQWRNAANGTISSSGGEKLGSSEFSQLAVSGVAPAGAVSAVLLISPLSSEVGKRFYWRRAQFEVGLSPSEWTPGVAHEVVGDGIHDVFRALTLPSAAGQKVRWRLNPEGVPVLPKFTTAERPSALAASEGAYLYDDTLNAIIYSDGAAWTVLDPSNLGTPAAKTAHYQMVAADRIVTTTAGTVSLPVLSTVGAGRMFIVKNTGTGNLEVNSPDGKNIDGGTQDVLVSWAVGRYLSDSVRWLKV